jgi:hypothetical protein
MTKKDFIGLADTIRQFNFKDKQFPENCRAPFTISQIAAIASYLHSTNPHFNRSRWFDYIAGECGPSGGKVR